MSTSTKYCGTAADDAGVGTVAWLNPTNAQGAEDGSYATNAVGAKATSHYLKCTNFSFAIPAGSTINGITVEFYRHTTAGNSDVRIRIVKSGSVGSTDRSIGAWAGSDQWDSAGSGSDLWGETWTVSDINASDFGVALAVGGTFGVADVDAVRITITYTAPPTYTATVAATIGGATATGAATFTKPTYSGSAAASIGHATAAAVATFTKPTYSAAAAAAVSPTTAAATAAVVKPTYSAATVATVAAATAAANMVFTAPADLPEFDDDYRPARADESGTLRHRPDDFY